MGKSNKFTPRQVAIKYGFRSGLEKDIEEQIRKHGIDPNYEAEKIKYIQPAVNRTYTPDFCLKGKTKDIYVETKGRFIMADRKKHQTIKKQMPDLDIRFVFNNSNSKIYKGSKTTYADWCTKNDFKYADKRIPVEWLNELD
jgi:hypothetical protein